jgi:hypothetical protein
MEVLLSDKMIKAKAQEYIVQNKRLFKVDRLKPRLYVPESMRTMVISACHDSKFAGHGGIFATSERVSLDYYWRGIDHDVKEYIKSRIAILANEVSMIPLSMSTQDTSKRRI